MGRMLNGVFAYRTSIPVEVLSLIDYDDNSTKAYWYEIIKAGMAGRINLNDYFNQRGYCSKIAENKYKSDRKDYAKCPHLDYEDNDTIQPFTVKAGSIKAMEDAFELFDEEDAVMEAYEALKETQKVLMVEEGIDLKMLLTNALDNIPVAVNRLRQLIIEDYYVPNIAISLSEQLQTILQAENASLLIESL